MATGGLQDSRRASQTVSPTWIYRVLRALARIVSRCAFEILRMMSPVVLPTLLWLAAGGVLIWVLFVPIAHDTDFPTLKVLLMSFGCLAGALGYCVLLETLRPSAR